jgi:hypothetical protein
VEWKIKALLSLQASLSLAFFSQIGLFLLKTTHFGILRLRVKRGKNSFGIWVSV